MGLTLRVGHHFRSTHRTVLETQLLAEHKIALKLGLIQELRGEEYKPKGDCPKCGRALTPAEIIRGFNQDPRDYTTRCPKCGSRFVSYLMARSRNGIGHAEMKFYCAIQTLDQMKGKEGFSPKELLKKHPAVYHSAIVHFGSIKNAFKQNGIAYPHEEGVDGWKDKIQSFLGRMPDTVIADCVDKPVGIIRKMRKELGIQRYTAEKALVEIE
ncbi:MAG: hypothetical protein AAB497_02520 [Patescibacteria group bacterium]